MKTFKTFVSVILALTLSSCNEKSNTNAGVDTSGQTGDIENVDNSEVLSGDDGLRKASVTAQCFVEDKMGECDFETLDYRGEETSVKNRFKVLQKFTNNGEQYVYRIFIQYFGGEWEDRNNWSYGQLVIENTKTGQQYTYHGDMKKRAESVMDSQNLSGIDAGGYHFEIAERGENVIRIYNEKKLSIEEIKKVVFDMRKTKKWNAIYFAITGKTERGQEYAFWQANGIYDVETDNVVGFNPDK